MKLSILLEKDEEMALSRPYSRNVRAYIRFFMTLTQDRETDRIVLNHLLMKIMDAPKEERNRLIELVVRKIVELYEEQYKENDDKRLTNIPKEENEDK